MLSQDHVKIVGIIRKKKEDFLCNFFVICFDLQVPSHELLGIPKHEEPPSTPPRPLSQMGDACSRMDLTAIHQILVMTHYKDDEGTNEVAIEL